MPRFANGSVEIAYLDEGEGEPVVLIHGFASNKEVNWMWPRWVATLTGAGHLGGVIVGRLVELARLAMAAVVERNHAFSGARQGRNPGRLHPVDLLGGGETVDEHDRLALALVEVRQFNGVVGETRHTDNV